MTEFIVKGIATAVFSQDVTVTEQKVRKVPVEEGDEVNVLVRALVSRAYGDEVELENVQPVKIVSVIRHKGRRK